MATGLNTDNASKIELFSSLDKSFITIEYDAENHWIYNDWKGYVTVKNVMAGAEACLDMLKKFKCEKLLNDNSNLVGPWTEANEWIETNWTPRAIASGFKYFAHIVSPGTFAAASAENMHKRVSDKFQMELFDNMKDARKWLKSF